MTMSTYIFEVHYYGGYEGSISIKARSYENALKKLNKIQDLRDWKLTETK